jgi:hypothetical protein
MERNRITLAAGAVAVAVITAACPGPPGPPGVSGYQIVVAESPVNSTVSKQVSDTCPTGKKALGAGWGVLDSTGAILDGSATYFEPSFNGAGWLVNARNNSAFAHVWKLRVRMTCAAVGP